MKVLKVVSLSFLASSMLILTSCLGDGKNEWQGYSTGSIYMVSGTPCMYVDRAGIVVTSPELQGEDFKEGDRLLATTTVNFDEQGTQIAPNVYNATITGVHRFNCENYIYQAMPEYSSDSLPVLYGVEPLICYRNYDAIMTVAYVKHDTEGENTGSLKLIQPQLYNYEAHTDTLYLVYDKGETKDSKSSEYVSFRLPPYPNNTDVKVVVRYAAEVTNFMGAGSGKDDISSFFAFTYNKYAAEE